LLPEVSDYEKRLGRWQGKRGQAVGCQSGNYLRFTGKLAVSIMVSLRQHRQVLSVPRQNRKKKVLTIVLKKRVMIAAGAATVDHHMRRTSCAIPARSCAIAI
jgi:hypothetical protein